MGYDVSVRFKNENERELMKEFLSQQKNLIEDISKTDSYQPCHSSEVFYGEDLGYTPKVKYLLGFHGTGIPKYIWDLCSWMAVKSSYRAKNENIFFYYDSEKMPVTFDINNIKNTVVTPEGIPVENKEEKKSLFSLFMPKEDIKKRIALFTNLNDNWNTFILEKSYIEDEVNKNSKKNKP